jgi:elongation factor P
MKAKDIRKGVIILYNNFPYRVMDFHHHTPGNLRAMVQTKLRNIINGTQTEVRFSSTEDLPEADVFTFNASFLYSDTDGYHFMNLETYDQMALNEDVVGDAAFYLQDQMQVEICCYNEAPISVKLPKTTILTIADTEPELRGATASNSPKPAKTDTGLALNVPAFVKIGDRIVVDTEEGRYLSRAEA